MRGSTRPLGQVALRGSALTGGQVVLNKVLATVATVLLGGLLTPEDFGLAGLAVSIGATSIIFQTWVFVDVAIAETRSGTPALAAAQAAALAFGVGQAAVIMAAAPVIQSSLDGRDGLVALLVVVAFRPLSDAIGVAPLARLRIDLRFRALAVVDGVTAAMGSIGSVALAYAGAGPAAVVAPPIATLAARGIVYWVILPASECPKHWPRLVEIVDASRRFVGAALAAYLTSVTVLVDSLVLGIIVAERSMGIYSFSYNLAIQATVVIAHNVASTVQPVFAAMGPDAQRQADGLLRTVRLVSVFTVPASIIQAAFAAPLFSAIWDDRWSAAVPVFVVLSVGQAMVFVSTPSIYLLKAQGRFGEYLKLAAMQLAFSIMGSFVAAEWGSAPMAALAGHIGLPLDEDAAAPLAVAVATSTSWAIFSPLSMKLACQGTTVGWRSSIGLVVKPMLVAVPLALGAAVAATALGGLAEGRPTKIAILLAAAAATFGATVFAASRLYETTQRDVALITGRLTSIIRPRL